MSKDYALPDTIVALQIDADPNGKPRLGLLTQLPKDAEIEVCGAGFDDRTVKIRSGQGFFYAFWQDVSALRLETRGRLPR